MPATDPILNAPDCFVVSVPLAGETVSQLPPTAVVTEACHERVPPPLLLSTTVCGSGLGEPATPAKLSVEALLLKAGAEGCPTVKLTGSVCVPDAVVKTSELLYTPGASPALFTLTCGDVGVVPLLLLTVSQDALLLTLHFTGDVHPCEPAIVMVFAVGAAC